MKFKKITCPGVREVKTGNHFLPWIGGFGVLSFQRWIMLSYSHWRIKLSAADWSPQIQTYGGCYITPAPDEFFRMLDWIAPHGPSASFDRLFSRCQARLAEAVNSIRMLHVAMQANEAWNENTCSSANVNWPAQSTTKVWAEDDFALPLEFH